MKRLIFTTLLILSVASFLMAQEEGHQGVLNGKFSISAEKQVCFSQGNLQYQATTDTWRFAEHQWTMIGADNNNFSPDYSGWIDLFAWGTGAYPTQRGMDYCGSLRITDWGENDISNTDNANWFTLSKEEWTYLLKVRNTTSGIRYAKAKVGETQGLILLPDDWDPSVAELQGVNGDAANYMTNTIDIQRWEKDFEANGAVFLPAAGRVNTKVNAVGTDGYYWSCTPMKGDVYSAFNVLFATSRCYPDGDNPKASGLSVRLVCPADDIKYKEKSDAKATTEPQPVVYKKFSVSEDKQVCFSKGNLQYQPSTGIWRFANDQWRYIGNSTTRKPAECVWTDLFGWGTGANPTLQSQNTADYSVFFDWGKVDISNGENKEWFTLTDDEWNYLLNNRSTTSGIRYAKAMVNCVSGIILLPDDWDPRVYELASANNPEGYNNDIPIYAWETILEPNGAIFLPAAGYRKAATIITGQIAGYYWSSTKSDDANAYNLLIAPGNVLTSQINGRNLGYSVRLVFVPEEEK